ncbi:MAG TPA: TIGR04084 family radical SAM/SPASM domain-containing protein [Patescibacteria group bacterium]|nr:TIGR04084 family radical SAM/SPASM domain-containing protein [Patescibacteria group bacterium]
MRVCSSKPLGNQVFIPGGATFEEVTMQYHLALTERCNLRCTYCGGWERLKFLPPDVTYDLDDLVRFISKDPEAVIGLYGGEPLLALDIMEKVMDAVPARAFTLQTNGTHLTEIPHRYLRKLHTILVSIDGGRDVTDSGRGEGTYDTVIRNLRDVEARGYDGDVIARMTVSQGSDIYRDVTNLLKLEDPRFDHVHWQLDVFWSEFEARNDLEGWLKRYDDGMTRLVADFGEAMVGGEVQGIVPFIPVMRTLITGESTPHVRCGAGIDSFAIMTTGRIEACPIAPDLEYSHVGDIRTSTPEGIRGSHPVGQPCTDCDILGVCGGRCLYANQTMSWGREWFDRVCDSTRHMISELEALVPTARSLMDAGVLPPDAFDYPKLNNSCEIIP